MVAMITPIPNIPKMLPSAVHPCGTFKIELLHTSALRTISLPLGLTLFEFNEIIQLLFGWHNRHIWTFQDAEENEYGLDEYLGKRLPDPICNCDARTTSVGNILSAPGTKARYTYDFGDYWVHRITRMTDSKTSAIRCKRTKGPDGIEDIGGPWVLMEATSCAHTPGLEEIEGRLNEWIHNRL